MATGECRENEDEGVERMKTRVFWLFKIKGWMREKALRPISLKQVTRRISGN